METTTEYKNTPSIKGVEIGKPIPEELSYHLSKYIGKVERALISHSTGIGFWQIDKLIPGNYKVSEDNYPALVEAIERAISKSEDEEQDVKVSKKKLKSYLNQSH